MGRDREDVRPATHQKNFVFAHMTEQLCALGELGKGNALGKVGPAGLALVLSHSSLPELDHRVRTVCGRTSHLEPPGTDDAPYSMHITVAS
jgi:hypothetical protein